MFSAESVCQFVCQHDNLQTIKCRMMKLGSYVHCTKISPEFECRSQRHWRQKLKSAAFCLGVVLWGASMLVGKSVHAVS